MNDDAFVKPKPEQLLSLSKIIWSIFFLFQMLLVGVAFNVWLTDHPGMDYRQLPFWGDDFASDPIVLVLFASAMASIVAGLKLRFKGFQGFVVRMVLFEFCGLIGFVVAFLKDNPMTSLIFVGIAAAAMATIYPTRSRVDQWSE